MSPTFDFAAEEDSIWCRQECATFAASLGFDREEVWTISIAVSEMVTNALKFAGGGQVTIQALEDPRRGIEVTVSDRGPGIADLERALQDGYSEGRMLLPEDRAQARGLGIGLGAIKRLMDEVGLASNPGGGLRVTARKWR